MNIPECPGLDAKNFEVFVKHGHDPEKVRKWGEALVSGDYKQGRDYLKTADGCFCCVGVGAEIFGIPNKLIHGTYDFSIPEKYDDGTSPTDAWLDPAAFLGGEPTTVVLYPNFAQANDVFEATFAQIGAWVLAAAEAMEARDAG